MKIAVLIPLFLLSSLILSGCGQTKIIEKPVPVEVFHVEHIPVPADLLVQHQPTTVPAELTYGEAVQLWAEDRAIIMVLLGQIRGIEALNDGNSDNP